MKDQAAFTCSGPIFQYGMTLRDYRATHILAGLLANSRHDLANADPHPGVDMSNKMALCQRAYMISDDLAKAAEVPTR